MKKFLTPLILLAAYGTHAKGPVMDTLTTPAYYRYVSHSQRYVSVLTGYNFGKEDYAELGVALNTKRRKKSMTGGYALYVADELKMRNNFIMGPKVGVWTGNGLAAGLALIYYTDMHSQGGVRLRPEIGIGEHNWRLTYGYNIPLSNSSFTGVDKHLLSLTILWKAAKLEEHTVARDWDPGGRKKFANRQRKDSIYSIDHGVVIAGLHGWTHMFGEAGIGLLYEETEKRKNSFFSGTAYISAEFRLGGPMIIGPKIGVYGTGGNKFGVCGGLSFIYYTGMSNSSLVGRPEIGLHYKNMYRLTYGYNHVFTNYAYSAIAPSNITAAVAIKWGKGKPGVAVKKEERGF